MRLNIFALSVVVAIFWGGAIFIVAIANYFWPSYGFAFLEIMSSVYPGFTPGTGFGSIIIGTLYALVDGAVGGAIFAWLYNFLSSKCTGSEK